MEVIKTDNFTVTDLGYKDIWVYDIETKNTHKFFANNILVHNSLYIDINDFCREHLGKAFWTNKTDDEKIDIIDSISDYVNCYINNKVLNEVQYGTYNSQIRDFPIKLEKEKIAKSGLFVAKKQYSVRCLWVDGKRKEVIKTTGISIVRGDSGEAVRGRLEDIMGMILRDEPDEKITERINQYKKELQSVYPEEIAANIGVNGLDKFIKNGLSVKGTPWHVKGVANYRILLNQLNVEHLYEDIHDSMKCKVVYIKDNPYNMETISFIRWPKEFDEVVEVDMNKMIDKFFIKKVEILLEPMNKLDMINGNMKKALNAFFV